MIKSLGKRKSLPQCYHLDIYIARNRLHGDHFANIYSYGKMYLEMNTERVRNRYLFTRIIRL